MARSRDGHRIGYDRLWGALLCATLFVPAAAGAPALIRAHFPDGRPAAEIAWLIAGTLGGIVALVAGFLGVRGRTRHFVNFALGSITLALPLVAPVIWQHYPHSNPARLPLGESVAIGWVMLLSLLAIYAGSGIRVARPTQFTGQALAALGAILYLLFASIPLGAGESAIALDLVRLLPEASSHLRELVPFGLAALATLLAAVNFVPSRAEVLLARLTRVLLAAALLFWLGLPLVEYGFGESQLPAVWGGLRLVAPLFLALDGCIAFLAISITRGNE